MAFLIHSTDDHRVPVLEYMPCAAIQPQVGMALTFDNGMLKVAEGTEPQYISMHSADKALEAGTLIPVVKLQTDMILEVPCSGAVPESLLGKTDFSVNAGGMSVGSNAGVRCFTCVSILESGEEESVIRVRLAQKYE